MRRTINRRTFLLTGGASAAAAWAETSIATPVTQETPVAPTVDLVRSNIAEIDAATIAEAQKLAGVVYTLEEQQMIAKTIGDEVERALRRRRFDLPNDLAPAGVVDPRGVGQATSPATRRFRGRIVRRACPTRDVDIAFASVTELGAWLRQGAITSRRLTELYLDRLERYGPELECTVTLTRDLALRQADRADRDLAAGRDRGALHGIPWGAKDLLDTAGIRTTWGATPYRTRVPETDAAVVRRLEDAGAVLVAKLTLGALAYGDIWYGGRTNNPWNVERGSSGSSAGSASATAAGLVAFALGTETLGSIVSPCMRCGTTGLRPTFGRVARTGAMALCWSLDKIGPITRSVEDAITVFDAIHGPDAGDPSAVDVPVDFDATRPIRGLRVGYHPSWFEGETPQAALERNVLERLRGLGVELVEVTLPDWPYDALMTILYAEAAAAFETLTLEDRDDELVWQSPQAWPNTFRLTRFISAVDLVQAARFRRRVMEMMAERFAGVDAMVSPSYAASLLLITNNTGHPALTIRAGFLDDATPHGITLLGRLDEEGTLARLGMALEADLDVAARRPPVGSEA